MVDGLCASSLSIPWAHVSRVKMVEGSAATYSKFQSEWAEPGGPALDYKPRALLLCPNICLQLMFSSTLTCFSKWTSIGLTQRVSMASSSGEVKTEGDVLGSFKELGQIDANYMKTMSIVSLGVSTAGLADHPSELPVEGSL